MQSGYSRKQKSLGLLCSNFMSLYDRVGVESVGVDDAATRLGVERRRIYDIVNVLESVGVLAKKEAKEYIWRGLGSVPRALDELKEEGFRDNHSLSEGNDHNKVSDNEDEMFSNQNSRSQPEKILSQKSGSLSKPDIRRENSLGHLTQSFVKLFLCSKARFISLDDASKVLLADGNNSTIMKTKVRRLYDVANVLTSLNLIEKTHQTENRKTAFRWIGLRGKWENHSSTVNKCIKRSFGTEITNIDFKRSRVTPSDTKSSQVRHYEFGPFAPNNVYKVQTTESKSKQAHDWDNLATANLPKCKN